jgi:lysophospholipase L1-like esterase
VKSTLICSCLLVGFVAGTAGCNGGGSSPGGTGGAGNGGVSASGGKQGSGGSGLGGSGSGGSVGRGGTPGTGGSGSGGSSSAGGGAGGRGTGGSATGGKASGGTAGAAGSQSGGASGATGGQGGGAGSGGIAAGGAPATGGQSAGGKDTGGSIGSGGAAGNAGGQGGRATGGAAGSGATGGASARGGSAAGGTSGAGGTTAGYHPCPTDGSACKIMPFGDSITDGYNSDTPGGYRVELFRLAHSNGKNITFVGSQTSWSAPSTVDGAAFPNRHEGHSGWTIYPGGGRDGISYCLSANSKCLASNSVMPEYKPDIALLMIGTNDCIVKYDLTNAPKRLGDLIDTIYQQLPNVLIVVAQPIPSRGDTSKGDDGDLTNRITTYNSAIPDVVKARADAGKHILLVNMFKPFVDAGKASLIEDEWHPNLKGYVLIGAQWYEVLKSLL